MKMTKEACIYIYIYIWVGGGLTFCPEAAWFLHLLPWASFGGSVCSFSWKC